MGSHLALVGELRLALPSVGIADVVLNGASGVSCGDVSKEVELPKLAQPGVLCVGRAAGAAI